MSREYSNLAVETTLAGAYTAGQTTVDLTSSTGWPVPGAGFDAVLILAPDTPATCQVLYYTGITGNQLTGVTSGRDGTASQSHAAGVKAVHGIPAVDAEGASGYFLGTVKEDVAALSVQAGVSAGTPRIVLSNGTAAQNWQVDNNAGEFRWFTPGVPRLSLIADPDDGARTRLTVTNGWLVAPGIFDETPGAARAQLGMSTTPGNKAAVGLFTATDSERWVVVNDAGVLAFYKAGVLEATLNEFGFNLPAGSEFTINGVPNSHISRVLAAQANSTITMANITNLTYDLAASEIASFKARIVFTSAATTTGVAFTVTTPAGATLTADVTIPLTDTTYQRGVIRSSAAAIGPTTGVTAATTRYVAIIEGAVQNGGTAGTLAMQFRSEIAGSAITIQPGSILVING